MKRKIKHINILAVIILLLSFLVFIVGVEKQEPKEVLCVDGENRINLEGFMCEEEVETFFGHNFDYAYLLLIPITVSLYALIHLFFRDWGVEE